MFVYENMKIEIKELGSSYSYATYDLCHIKLENEKYKLVMPTL